MFQGKEIVDHAEVSAAATERHNLRISAEAFINKLKKDLPNLDEGLQLAQKLQESLEFDLLDRLTTELRRSGDERSTLRLLQAQSLIERGAAISALDVLEASAARLPEGSHQWAEAHGLMGRAWKQILFETKNETSERARVALANSIREYAIPYRVAPTENVWHGLNLLALANFARAKCLTVGAAIDSERLASDIISSLTATPEPKRNNWYHGSLAEAYLALNDLDEVESNINSYVRDPKTTAFALGGTIRQFTDLWLLDRRGEREHGIIQSLRAALMKKQGFDFELSPEQMHRALGNKPTDEQLESILGPDGPRTYKWFQLGLESGRAVGAVWQGELGRIGSGFLIRGGDFREAWGDELLVLTNAHVVSDEPADGGISSEEACIKFEAVDKNKSYGFDRILWISGINFLDAVILKLKEPVTGIAPLRHTPRLPLLDGKQRVYVIGYPGGGELSISFQDNILLDHEGPPNGTPVDENVCHLQYRAPTEKGSSGSPVFNATDWCVVALHHAGGQAMRRLNGNTERWPANEGIWIRSILDSAVKQTNVDAQ
jgi:V8-like Glu-specific endopeptidase